ncbi:protein PSY2-like [Cucurbita moschata]|uniref:Protein PSY2-like n=1 Tax=Cucurbita moschata TaxID=3662 RepID=A0A6J1E2S8_CUCMO|nr:protein PSY2-like [Cucurbita moschata]
MSPSLKFFLLLLLLLSISVPFSSGVVESGRNVKVTDKVIYMVGGVGMNGRKLMRLDVEDYDDTKANNRHDPKKPGNGKP